MDGGAIFGVALCMTVAAIVLVPRYFKNKERQDIQATVRAAIDKGQEMPADLVEAIARERRPAHSPTRDIRAGVIWLGVAIGLAAFGYSLGFIHEGAEQGTPVFMGLAAFPGFVGLALVILGVLGIGGDKK